MNNEKVEVTKKYGNWAVQVEGMGTLYIRATNAREVLETLMQEKFRPTMEHVQALMLLSPEEEKKQE